MGLRAVWAQSKFCMARERVHAQTAREVQATLLEAATIVTMAARQEFGIECDPELPNRCRRLASQLFSHYGPQRNGSRMFILAKQRARTKAISAMAAKVSAALAAGPDERELS